MAAVWARLAPREQRALRWAMGVVVLACLWWGVGAPAWKTWQRAPQQHRVLDAQWQQVQTLAQQARQLQAQPRLSRDDRLRALETATQRLLGTNGKLQVSGDQATVTLQRASADGLANWLAEVRANARLTPAETRLTRDVAAAPPTANTPTAATTSRPAASGAIPPTWSGMIFLSL
ncbi:MAG: hypothetical protein RLZZ612_1990 [Pseudomonadota bacterium]